MIDWPSNPTPGQVFNSGTGPIYIWDGVAWNLVTGATKTANRKNLITNPALQISQENGTAEGVGSGYWAADMFVTVLLASGAAIAFGLVAADNPSGSSYRLRWRTTTVKASLAAGDYAGFATKVEGCKSTDLNWDGAVRNDAVLRFMVNMPAGTWSIAIRNSAQTYAYVTSFTISAAQAGVDTPIVLPIPAPPAGMNTWDVGNTVGLDIWFTFASGTSFLANAGWGSGNLIGVNGMSNGLAAVQSFQAWDFGLYADPYKTKLPPDFEIPDIADEQGRCMRYFENGPYAGFVGYNNPAGNGVGAPQFYKAKKRVQPTIAILSWASTGNVNSQGVAWNSIDSFMAVATLVTAGAGYMYGLNASVNARM